MAPSHRNRPLSRAAAAGIVAISALGLTACAGDGEPAVEVVDEEPAVDDDPVEDVVGNDEPAPDEPFDGPYDGTFFADIDTYAGEEVTVTAAVEEVISPTSFTITDSGGEGTEPLLVAGTTEVDGLEPGSPVAVTGMVLSDFDMPIAEEDLGVDLDDALYEEFDGEPYIEATSVDTEVPTGG